MSSSKDNSVDDINFSDEKRRKAAKNAKQYSDAKIEFSNLVKSLKESSNIQKIAEFEVKDMQIQFSNGSNVIQGGRRIR